MALKIYQDGAEVPFQFQAGVRVQRTFENFRSTAEYELTLPASAPRPVEGQTVLIRDTQQGFWASDGGPSRFEVPSPELLVERLWGNTPDGGVGYITRITDTNTAATEERIKDASFPENIRFRTQNYEVFRESVSLRASVYIRKASADHIVRISLQEGSNWQTTSIPRIDLDTDTGAYAAVGQVDVTAVGDYWRCTLFVTLNPAESGSLEDRPGLVFFLIRPAWSATLGGAQDPTLVGPVDTAWWQVDQIEASEMGVIPAVPNISWGDLPISWDEARFPWGVVPFDPSTGGGYYPRTRTDWNSFLGLIAEVKVKDKGDVAEAVTVSVRCADARMLLEKIRPASVTFSTTARATAITTILGYCPVILPGDFLALPAFVSGSWAYKSLAQILDDLCADSPLRWIIRPSGHLDIVDTSTLVTTYALGDAENHIRQSGELNGSQWDGGATATASVGMMPIGYAGQRWTITDNSSGVAQALSQTFQLPAPLAVSMRMTFRIYVLKDSVTNGICSVTLMENGASGTTRRMAGGNGLSTGAIYMPTVVVNGETWYELSASYVFPAGADEVYVEFTPASFASIGASTKTASLTGSAVVCCPQLCWLEACTRYVETSDYPSLPAMIPPVMRRYNLEVSGTDIYQLANSVRVEGGGGADHTEEDTLSIATYGKWSAEPVVDDSLDATGCENRAKALLALNGRPRRTASVDSLRPLDIAVGEVVVVTDRQLLQYRCESQVAQVIDIQYKEPANQRVRVQCAPYIRSVGADLRRARNS